MTRPVRILVVEDNEDLALLLAETLEEIGHEVRVAHSGPAALEIGKHFRPELAILDLGLPVMSGFELASALKQSLSDGAPRLFALSGFGGEDARSRARAAGFEKFFVKPLLPEVLTRAIEEPGA